MATFYIIASAEDNAYQAWQCKLLHWSCTTVLGAAPLLFVHGFRERPEPAWEEIARAGGVVYGVPSDRRSPATGRDYPPRNGPGTLLHAAELTEDPDVHFVLCDPDMLFVRPPEFRAGLSGDHYDYLDFSLPAVRAAARRTGLSDARLDGDAWRLRVGVPYVIPAPLARPLGDAWMTAIDAFDTHDWIDGMHAFGLAVARLGLPIATTRHMITDADPGAPVTAPMLHYCYGDARWNKRQFMTADDARRVWHPAPDAPAGSVRAAMFSGLRAAGEYYDSLT